MTAQPLATYRVQLHAAFGFDDAAAIASYLSGLGVSHLYSSPYLQAAPGSTHGYDAVDHRRVNHELGGPVAHQRFCRTLGEHRLGQVLDVVPNHMAVVGENPWWWDVLENGPSSRYAHYFDVDWDPPEGKLRTTVLMPILGDHYGRVLEAGELQLEREGGAFHIRYHEHVLPVAPRSVDGIVGDAAHATGSDELAFLADAFGALPPSTATDRLSVRRRHRDKEVLRNRLARLAEERPEVGRALDEAVQAVNADPDALDALLERQNYRLALWRTAGRELDYRRFFDVTTLIGLRIEERDVFDESHELILRWLRDGVLDGLRIDHPDGLRDPDRYFEWLREAAPEAWIVAEKILEPGEELPSRWPVAGTTGYDFLNVVGGLFVDPAGEGLLTDLYASFTGEPADYATVVRDAKMHVLRDVLGSELNRLTALFVDVCHGHRRHRDYTRHELHEALREVVAAFPVYRTYVRAEAGIVTPTDERYIGEAISAAREARPDLDPELFAFLRDVLVLRVRGDAETELVMRFQQLTGPAMAKGVEDTAFYRYGRLVALNEVGGDPSRFGTSLEDFHERCRETQAAWPSTMLTTSTHDTKRSEDVRLRIALLSEIPDRWREAVARLSKLAEPHRIGDLPDRAAEYLLLQMLVGAWPLDAERATTYMTKAVREAKQHTSWTDPSPGYEAAVERFVRGLLADETFGAELAAFVAPLVEPARTASLAQTLIKLTAPGVPDLYQGSELWDASLVDPDNRRPVDFALRQRLLGEAAVATPAEALARMDEGLPKLWLIRRALAVRRAHRDAFGPHGGYEPLAAEGGRAAHVVAYVRGDAAITVAPRLLLGLGGGWQDTTLRLPAGEWHDALGGAGVAGTVALRELLATFPAALLVRRGAPAA